MAQRTITNESNSAKVAAGHLLLSGQSAQILDASIDEGLFDAIQAGTFSVSPALDDGFDASSESNIEDDAIIVKMVEQFRSGNKAFVLPGDINPANDPQTVLICCVDGNGVVNSFEQELEVTVAIQSDATGGASIAEAMPIKMVNGCGEITLSGGGGSGDVVLELVDSETTGLDVSDELTATFVVI
jgi:hypothetical protein